MLPRPSRPRIKCIVSDTGGGHRAAAEAVRAALTSDADVEILDILVAAGGVSSGMPALYDWFTARPGLWGPLWHAFDRPELAWLLSDPFYAMQSSAFVELINRDSPDLVAVFHPCCTRGTRRAMAATRHRSALVTVVTDPVTAHTSWFEPDVDRIIVSSETARKKALASGVSSERITVLDHPVHPRVYGLAAQRAELRAQVGWSERIVLITGGGCGFGVEAAAHAVRSLGARVIVACGRDERVRARLSRHGIETLGFIADLPERMCAADLVLTKAGPSTLAECRAVGTPMIITSHIPGQEEGNLDWIQGSGAGEVAQSLPELTAAVVRWLSDDERRAELRSAAMRPAFVPVERIAQSFLQTIESRAHVMSPRLSRPPMSPLGAVAPTG